jgi:hypothetical protein
MRTRWFQGLFALSLTYWAYGNFQAPHSEDSWLAQIFQSQQLLRMEFHQIGGRLSGSAALARLTEPGAEALTLAGTQQADTLDISFARLGVPSFRFLGWYVNNRIQIVGTLTGAEFTDVGVVFRKQ